MVEHSPTPWIQVDLHPEIILANGQLAMHSFSIQPDPIIEKYNPRFAGDLQEANAAFIVKAVNNHDALVKALKHIVTLTDERGEIGSLARAVLESVG